MRIKEVTIRNFKAIENATITLSERMTVIVGANGSGKSSILQALHWMFQSGRNLAVDTNKVKNGDFRQSDGSTLSEKDATYMPTPEYRNSSHGAEYGNKKGSPQMEVEVIAIDDEGQEIGASMWIKVARNEGLSVHIPSNNSFVQKLRDQSKEFSSYIPGLAGISPTEEKRTKLIVRRRAAAGDANTVLRNVLLLLKGEKLQETTALDILCGYVSKVMGKTKLFVEFDEDKHQTIQAYFQTESMIQSERNRKKPLELAGIGFLQVIQIFSYLIYFRPKLLLVDEPDAHLHPSAQERLVNVLAEAAEHFETQVILTTHSPSVVRALPDNSIVVWMKDGNVQPDGDTAGRQLMGWGLLDKRILLLTEDSKTGMLRSILSQWPELERVVAIWPLHGTGKLLNPEGCVSLKRLFGNEMEVVLHRDKDFMMPEEVNAFLKPYAEKGIKVWMTRHSDIESYWADKDVIRWHFRISEEDAEKLIEDALKSAELGDEARTTRNKKRNDIRNKLPECKNGQIGAFNDDQVVEEYSRLGRQYVVLGKKLCEKIRESAQLNGYDNVPSFGKIIPAECVGHVADDLREFLKGVL